MGHHRSSTSVLISVIYDWLTALEDGNKICVIFFDIQKSFDSVPCVPLLQNLADIGIDLYLLGWIQSYLTNRMQYVVVVVGASSPILQVLPQGSLLGPLLFFFFHLNDVVHCISEGSEANIYADDIALYLELSGLLRITFICRQTLMLLQPALM